MRFRLSLFISLLIAAVAVPGHAFVPKVSTQRTSRGVEVTVNGRAALRFRASNGNLSVSERASITAQRLVQAVSAGTDPWTISAKGNKWQTGVYAGSRLICMATKADALSARSTPLALAQSWAANTRSLLLMPPIVLSDRSITVPLGETRRITVGGAATGPVSARPVDAVAAIAKIDPATRQVTIVGQQTGYTIVEVSTDGEKATFDVHVKKYAGAVPASAFAEVTGSPCPGDIVKYAAVQAVLRSAVTEPDARIDVENIDEADASLGAGNVRRSRVKVRISGPEYITWAGESVAEIHNSVMPPDQVQQLFYSNNPERLLKYQTLFTGKLDPQKSTRVLYHHQNAMGKRARLLVEVINPQPLPATFRVFKSVSSPRIDTVLVGYLATMGFLKDQQMNASVIERVPAHSRLVLVSDLLDNLDTSSGILQIRQTDGNGAYVRVAALPPDLDAVAPGALAAAVNEPVLDISQHIYPSPARVVETDYVVGQRWAFISIGKQAVQSHDEQVKLLGNYGVTYEINVRVENPTLETKKVKVIFDPTAGLASGVFIIDGEIVSTKYAKPPSEIPLASYELKPGETRKVSIVTLPVAGSNYPATLVVRS